MSGFGDSFKTGGKVVKNVTGYDLCKLLAGSWGTLAVMTEVTLKVMPKPESERTLMLRGLDDVTANRAMTAALGSPFDVSARRICRIRRFGPAAGALAGAASAGPGGHPAAAGGHRGLGGTSRRRRSQGCWRRSAPAEMLEDAASAGGLEFASATSAVRGRRRARRLAGVADRLSAGFRRRARPGAGARDRRRRDLRLGRRADLGGAAAEAGRAGRAGAPARRCRRAATPR